MRKVKRCVTQTGEIWYYLQWEVIMGKNRIFELRKQQHKTLQDVGDAVGLGNNTISRYENGKHEPKIETWQKLADYFNVSVPYIMGIDEKVDHNPLKINQTFMANTIKNIIKDKKITPKELGEMMDPPVSENTVLQWENGELPDNYYNQLAQLAGIRTDKFITGLSDNELARHDNLLELSGIEQAIEEQKEQDNEAVLDEMIMYQQDLDYFTEFYNNLLENKKFDQLETISRFFDMIQKAYK